MTQPRIIRAANYAYIPARATVHIAGRPRAMFIDYRVSRERYWMLLLHFNLLRYLACWPASTALGCPVPEREKIPDGRPRKDESDADSTPSRKKARVVVELSSHHAYRYSRCIRIRRSVDVDEQHCTGRSNARASM